MSTSAELLAEIESVQAELEYHQEMVERFEIELARLTAELETIEDEPDYLV